MNKFYVPADSTSRSLGSDQIAELISAQHDQAEIVRNGSWGLYWLEPMVEIEHQGIRHAFGPVDAEDVESLMTQDEPNNNHAKYLGPTEELRWLTQQQRLTFERVGVIDPLSIDAYKEHGGFQGLESALKMGAQGIIEAVKESGLRGRGGAAFPTGIKWQTVADAPSDKKFIVCNADEGDSGTFADRMLMESDPFCLIEGMIIAGLAVGADEGYIYTRAEYPQAIETLEKAVELAEAQGLLGDKIMDSEYSFTLYVRKAAGAYICGEETSLLESLEGKRGEIRYKPPLPAIEGLFGKPTVVNNVISLASVPTIISKGADHYKNFGSGRSRGTLTVQLAGNVKRGGLFELPFGISLRTVLEDIGGGTATGRPVKTVQVGGPLGAYIPESDFDTPLDYEDFAAIGMLGHGGIVVFDDSVDLGQMARFALEFCALESCGKCTPCRVGAVRGVETIDKILNGENVDSNKVVLDDLCHTMIDGSLCALGGMAPFPVLSIMKHYPDALNES